MKNRQVVVITGSSGGIGKALCSFFSEKGYYVVGIDKKNTDDNTGISRFIHADIGQLKDIEKAASSIIAKEARIDVLVNNAAFQLCKSLLETTSDEWDNVFAVNVRAPFFLVQKCYPLLKKTKGVIVNIASVHALASSCDIAAYAASKGALATLTRNMAIEFSNDSIRVNALLLGAVDTSMLRAGLKRKGIKGDSIDERISILEKKHIIGRIARPDEIAKAVYFLADNKQSSFVTGQLLAVDGGALAKLSTE